jgi:DNA-binding transcriptional MocR family regulator
MECGMNQQQQRAVVQQALEAMDSAWGYGSQRIDDKLTAAITALRQLLEQPEPVQGPYSAPIKHLWPVAQPAAWVGLMRGVRVDGDTVVISTKNNYAARHLCCLLLHEKGDTP